MAKFKRYDSYKNSGVEWLGEIPSHWEMLKTKYVHKSIKFLNTNRICDNVLSLTLRGVVNNNIDNPEGLVPKDYATYQIFEKNDLVFKLIDLENISTSRVGIVHEKGIMSSAYIRLKIGKRSIPKFAYYYYYSLYINNVYNNIGCGVRSTLNPTDLLNIKFPLPPKDEQEKIALYLDEKIAKIDASISGKEKFIELLKEQKQIIINDAVTKGLNKNAKFKNSGVEWLGEIPSHWEILKLKFVGKIFAGLSDKKGDDFSKEFTSDKKPFIPFTNVCNNLKIDKNQMQYVKINPHEMQNKVREKDIIFLMSSETLEDIGKCSIYLEKEQLYLNSFCKGFRPNLSRINAEFLNYLLQSKTYRNYFNLAGRGFTRINIKQEYISNLCAILPPKDEQEKIVEYIENKISKIDKLLNLEQEYIKSLKEYKASLIDSVVTGKVKV